MTRRGVEGEEDVIDGRGRREGQCARREGGVATSLCVSLDVCVYMGEVERWEKRGPLRTGPTCGGGVGDAEVKLV